MTWESIRPATTSPYSKPPAQPITVGIADDHPQFCTALAHTITGLPGLLLAFTAHNGTGLLEETTKTKPQVVLTDIQMPFMDGAKACQLIKEMLPKTGVIALSMYCDQHHVLQMYQAGARGYLTKGAGEAQIYDAIQQVNNEGTYWCASASQHLQAFTKRTMQPKLQHSSGNEQFSELELNVMRLICEEKSCKLIANDLNICKRTIDSVYERLRRKTGAHNLVGIATYAIRNGLAGLCGMMGLPLEI